MTQTLLSIAEEVEYDLFTTILRNPQHVLQPYLQERSQLHYHLRNRLGLSKSLIQKTVDLNSSPTTCIKLVTERVIDNCLLLCTIYAYLYPLPVILIVSI